MAHLNYVTALKKELIKEGIVDRGVQEAAIRSAYVRSCISWIFTDEARTYGMTEARENHVMKQLDMWNSVSPFNTSAVVIKINRVLDEVKIQGIAGGYFERITIDPEEITGLSDKDAYKQLLGCLMEEIRTSHV